MKKLVISSLFLLVSSVSLWGEEQVRLYKEYYFGMPKKTIAAMKEIYDCSEDMERDAMCLSEQSFQGVEVELAFIFNGDQLVSVSAYADYTEENHDIFFNAIHSKFQLIVLFDGKGMFDIMKEYRAHGKSEVVARTAEIMTGDFTKNDIDYIFWERSVYEQIRGRATDFYSIVKLSPLQTRSIGMTEYVFEEKPYILLEFLAPVLESEMKKKQNNRKVEAF